MKTSKILKLAGIILLGMFLTVQVNAITTSKRSDEKKAIVVNVNKPIIEFISKVYAGQIDSKDILKIQKMIGQIDHVTISFRDEDAADYQLKFETMDNQDLESWMFDEGYLVPGIENEMEVPVPWMENMNLSGDHSEEMEVSVPWMENMNFSSTPEIESEVLVPWMDNMHLS